jgi:probable FeS assembly SUF system protein SufT
MHQREYVTLTRDCDAVQVPEGTATRLHAGTEVAITQSLGGTYTVMTPYGLLVRIDERNADALGKEAPPAPETDEAGSLDDLVWAQLRKCYDPEIPVNIVDLGLVYDCTLSPADDGRSKAHIKMTLTAPGCGMGDVLTEDVRRRVEELSDVAEADVELVFDPQWSMEMMSEAARLELGML